METNSARGPNESHGAPVAALFLQATQELGADALRSKPLPKATSHADLVHLNRLVVCSQTMERLKDTSWFGHLPVQLSTPLDAVGFASILLRLYESASSGVITARNRHGSEKIVAITTGAVVAAVGNAPEHKFGAYLQHSGTLDAQQAQRAADLMQHESKPLGWALLYLGYFSTETLLRAQQAHAEHLVQELLSWPTGDVEFRETSAVVDLHRVIDSPTLALLRQNYAHVYRQNAVILRSFTAPFFARTEGLHWRQPTPRAVSLIEGVRTDLIEHAHRHDAPAALLRTIEAHEPAQQARDLADVYVLATYGYLTFGAQASPHRLANIPASFHSQDAVPDAMAQYRTQQEVIGAARRLLMAGDPQAAEQALLHITKEVEPAKITAETFAYLAIALALNGDGVNAQRYAHLALHQHQGNALAHAAMARAMQVQNQTAQAAYHHKTALALSQNDPTWYAEINAALAVLGPGVAPTLREAPRDGRALTLWVAGVSLLLSLFAAAMIFRMGHTEYFYQPTDTFFYIRRLTLGAAGLIGLCLWQGLTPFKAIRKLKWRVKDPWWQLVVLYGILAGLASPTQRVTGGVEAVLALTLLHVVCEEIFFRAFLTRMLLDQCSETRLAILLSAIIYGAYHVTYYSFWVESGWQPRLYYVGLIAAFAGVPYAWLYTRTQTLTAPVLCHAAVSLVMMGMSLSKRMHWLGLGGH